MPRPLPLSRNLPLFLTVLGPVAHFRLTCEASRACSPCAQPRQRLWNPPFLALSAAVAMFFLLFRLGGLAVASRLPKPSFVSRGRVRPRCAAATLGECVRVVRHLPSFLSRLRPPFNVRGVECARVVRPSFTSEACGAQAGVSDPTIVLSLSALPCAISTWRYDCISPCNNLHAVVWSLYCIVKA